MDPTWLDWVRRLQGIAQNGLTYVRDPYDAERYEAVRVIAAEMAAAYSGAEPVWVRDLFAVDTGHITPKVDVRGATFRDDRVLLVRERQDGKWTLPGGWADPGEPPSVTMVREVVEESGYRVRATKLAMVYDRDRHGHTPMPFTCYKLFFVCTLVANEPVERGADGAGSTAHGETDEADFFAADALPPLSIPRVTEAEILRLFEHQRHPDWPTDFD